LKGLELSGSNPLFDVAEELAVVRGIIHGRYPGAFGMILGGGLVALSFILSTVSWHLF
jgi:hypothetical protein